MLPVTSSDRTKFHVSRARGSLRNLIVSYSQHLRSAKKRMPNPPLEAHLDAELTALKGTLDKLDRSIVRLAVFGLVSRGKSAVINALVGEDLLETGPINGVTQKPRVIKWTPGTEFETSPVETSAIAPTSITSTQIELIDTPGLDEIGGAARAEMAREVARQADLILFVISGDMTQTEFKALCELRSAQKPLILVFNKIDLYPDRSRTEIYENLASLESYAGEGNALRQMLSRNEIVLIAANPTPIQVRVERPDGTQSFEWERLSPEIDELKAKILTILDQEGRSLLALNALTQARSAEARMVEQIVNARSIEAEALIWKFVRYKAIAVAANPIPGLDWIGGTISDVVMIRELSNLYGFSLTRYEAGTLLTTIAASSIGLLLGEICSNIVLSAGKAVSAIASVNEAPGLGAYASVAAVQAGVAGYGSYAVGRAAQVYLERGCSWGNQGSNTVIQEILDQIEPNTILWRIRSELF